VRSGDIGADLLQARFVSISMSARAAATSSSRLTLRRPSRPAIAASEALRAAVMDVVGLLAGLGEALAVVGERSSASRAALGGRDVVVDRARTLLQGLLMGGNATC